MAKRARGTTSRPGQRRPIQRAAARPASAASPSASAAPVAPMAPRSASLTPEEEARAATLEAAIVAEERQAEEGRRSRAQRSAPVATVRSSTPLATAAANEYGYVARDIRKVAIVGGSLIGVLIVVWAVTQITGVPL